MANKYSNIKERVLQIPKAKGITKQKFFSDLGMSYGNFTGKNKETPLNSKAISNITSIFRDINLDWLINGEGNMLKSDYTTEAINPTSTKKNIIPYYRDVHTIGGASMVADTEAVYQAKDKIDAGEWFIGATAAITHYGDSMKEYPSGCTLVIQEINDKNEFLWGKNYVIETSDMRITKKLAQLSDTHISCHSTNTDTYPDGTLINQPIPIKKTDIRYAARVLGYINKE